MRFLKWWLILAVLCLAGLLGFSDELRRVVRMEVRGLAGPMGNPRYQWQLKQWERSWTRASAGEAGKDWRLVWAAAEFMRSSVLRIGDPIAEFQRALELNPQSRELRCRLGMALARGVSFQRSDEANIYVVGAPPKPGEKEKLPDPGEVAAALGGLKEAKRLDADNGFLDYLSAYVLFAAHRDEEGNEALRRVAANAGWRDYRVEAAQAAQYCAQRSGLPRYLAAAAWNAAGHLSTRMEVRRLVKWLSGWGRLFEERGRHREAIERWRLTFLIGERMRTNAPSVGGVLMAVIATESAGWTGGARRVSKEELDGVEYDAPWPGRSAAVAGDSAGWNVENQLELERFCAYLSAHGADDLALRVRADVAAARYSREEVIRKVRLRVERLPVVLDGMRVELAEQGQGLAMGSLLALALIALLCRLRQRVTFRVRLGLFPIMFGLVLAAPVAWWWSRAVAVAREIPRDWMQFAPSWWWAPVIALGPVALLLVACWVHAVVSRRRRACVRGWRWFLLHWLGDVNVTSLWAIAVLLTIFLLLFIPISIYGARVEHYYQEVLVKGEIAVLLGR